MSRIARRRTSIRAELWTLAALGVAAAAALAALGWAEPAPARATAPSAVATASENAAVDGTAALLRRAAFPASGPMWTGEDDTRPRIAIVLDDAGLRLDQSRAALRVAGPLTVAVLAQARGAADFAAEARAAGHEVWLHMPMQALDGRPPGPRPLLVGLEPDAIAARLDWHLERVGPVAGVNNHMGSRFTANEAGVRALMRALDVRGLRFLDSRTSPESRALAIADRLGVPAIGRDVFLDDDREPAAIAEQIARLLAMARARGHAVAIGHPHPETIAAISALASDAGRLGVKLVPLSDLIAHRAVRQLVAGP